MAEARQFGDLQLAILRVLWRRGEATVAQVHAELVAERGLAPTTIATMLQKMEKKRLVAHRADGRVFVYRARIDEPEATRSMVREFLERVFEGDPAALLSHLLDQGDLDRGTVARLRRTIAERRDHRARGGDP